MRESAKGGLIYNRRLALTLSFLLSSLGNETIAQETETATYIDSLRQQRDAMPGVMLKCTTNSRRIVPDDVIDAESSSQYDVLIDFRTRSCRIAWTSSGKTILNGGQSTRSQTEHIVTPRRYFRVSETERDPLSVSSSLLPSDSDWTEAVTGFPIFSMFGYFPVNQGGGSLTALLGELKDVELQPERIDGATCSLVSGAIKEGELSVWFDADHGNIVRRLEIHRTAANPDFLFDSYVYEVLAFQEAGGTIIPEEFRVTQVLPPYGQRRITIEPGVVVTLGERQRTLMVSECSIESIGVALDCTEADFQPHVNIPDGTSVRMKDLSLLTPLKFEWRDGEIFSLAN